MRRSLICECGDSIEEGTGFHDEDYTWCKCDACVIRDSKKFGKQEDFYIVVGEAVYRVINGKIVEEHFAI